MQAGPNSIDETLRLAQTGNRAAFSELIETHQAMVYSLLLHVVSEEAVAEEIAQDVFLELHKNLASIESGQHLVRWLRTVATRRGIDEVRRWKFRSPRPIEDLPEPGVDSGLHDVLLSVKLQKLLNRLPAKHRAIVVLRYQEDLDPSDIALQLEMPVATVKSTLHRALGMLRRALERTGIAAQDTLLKREAV